MEFEDEQTHTSTMISLHSQLTRAVEYESSSERRRVYQKKQNALVDIDAFTGWDNIDVRSYISFFDNLPSALTAGARAR